jgi:hypothetical protein
MSKSTDSCVFTANILLCICTHPMRAIKMYVYKVDTGVFLTSFHVGFPKIHTYTTISTIPFCSKLFNRFSLQNVTYLEKIGNIQIQYDPSTRKYTYPKDTQSDCSIHFSVLIFLLLLVQTIIHVP